MATEELKLLRRERQKKMRCKAKANLQNGYALEVRCDYEEGHTGGHIHSNYVDIKEGGEACIDVTWSEEE